MPVLFAKLEPLVYLVTYLIGLLIILRTEDSVLFISGVQSERNFISAEVPQGSILGPLLFLLYINDISNEIGSNTRLFADDTSLFVIVENPDTAARLMNDDMNKISVWAGKW